MNWLAENLPHATALLNSTAAVLLLLGLYFIKSGREIAHRNTMIACFATSGLFLLLYLFHKYVLFEVSGSVNRKFPADPELANVRVFYLVLLASHILLAISVPPMAIAAIVLGLKNQRDRHRKLVRWAYPVWMYVSITGVAVYWMLYWAYPSTAT